MDECVAMFLSVMSHSPTDDRGEALVLTASPASLACGEWNNLSFLEEWPTSPTHCSLLWLRRWELGDRTWAHQPTNQPPKPTNKTNPQIKQSNPLTEPNNQAEETNQLTKQTINQLKGQTKKQPSKETATCTNVHVCYVRKCEKESFKKHNNYVLPVSAGHDIEVWRIDRRTTDRPDNHIYLRKRTVVETRWI